MSRFIVMLTNPGGDVMEHAAHGDLSEALNDLNSITITDAMNELDCRNLLDGETIDVELRCERDLLSEVYADGVLIAIRSFTNRGQEEEVQS